MESTDGGSFDNDQFKSLPTEILQKIFGYLPVQDRVCVERVCKRWKNVSTERVWRDVQVLHIISPDFKTRYHRFRDSLKKFGEFITMESNELFIGTDELGIIKNLVSRAGQHVKKIILTLDRSTSTESILSIIAAHCHNIESIKSYWIEKSAVKKFSELLRVNKQLRSITCLHADDIIGILPLRDWKSLDLRSDNDIQEEDWNSRLVELVENSTSLQKLHIHYPIPKLLAAIPKCEQLKILSFPSWFVEERHEEIMSPSLLNCLTCLKLTGMSTIGPMIDLLRHCINLESLSVSNYFGKLPPEFVRAVLALPKLECLELGANSITDKILILLLKFKRLEFDSFSNSITENGIFEMIMNSECLEKLRMCEIKVTMEFFKRLVQNTGNRRKALEIEVSTRIYEVALEICKGSKIHIIERRPRFLI